MRDRWNKNGDAVKACSRKATVVLWMNTTLQLFHKKNIVQDFLMYNEFDPKHYKGK